MAGKYHRTYLREEVQKAFEAMQDNTGVASNAYILEAVEYRLRKEGYLGNLRVLPNNGVVAREPREGRRKRRARNTA